MNRMAGLTSAVLDLLHELRGSDVRLAIGGGFGVYLRFREIMRLRVRTLFTELPEPRSTNDIDLFLRAELLADTEKISALARALDRLGYRAVETAKYYQFMKPGSAGDEIGSIKIDILTGPRRTFEAMGLKSDERRVRPKAPVLLHAHPVDEALTLEEQLLPVRLDGSLTTGVSASGEVFLPHSFTFITMKLFALRDSMEDPLKGFGRHHALDLYAIVGLMTADDWDSSVALRDEHCNDPKIIEAARIVEDLFGSELDLGILRLKESSYYRSEFRVAEYIKALRELLGRRQ